MGLIVFVWFFAVFLAISTLYAFAIKNRFSRSLTLCSGTALLATLALISLLHILYSFRGLDTGLITKLYLLLLLILSFFMLQFALDFPLFEKSKKSSLIFNLAYHSVGVILILLQVGDFVWNPLYGFKFASNEMLGLSSIRILILLYVFASSVFMLIIFFNKIFSLQNLIFRQQSFLMFLSMIFVSAYWFFIYNLFNVYSWSIIIQPLGYVVFIVCAFRCCSLSMTFDKKQVFFAFLRFLVFGIIPAICIGALSAYILTNIRSFYYQILLLLLSSMASLLITNFIYYRLRHLLGDTREYQEFLFSDLQRIDYTQGRKDTAKEFSHIIQKYLGSPSIDIMVESDSGVFETIHSTVDNAYTYDARNRVFDFVLDENISLLSRNSILVDAKYADYRVEFLSLLNKSMAEIVVFLREGNRLIGLIFMGRKSAHQDYTAYDMVMLKEIYSYFFLIVYYLRNIAKENVVITVDKEIEMSDQIISSIQKNMDIIHGKNINVANISYSAHQLGGDFIDFIRLEEDKYFFVIGDVSGKGLSASMSMVILKSVLRTFLIETRDFKELVSKINVFIKTNLPRSTFFAGLFAILDIKNNTIYYINCGIPLMSMYMDSYKNVIEIQGEGRVLGFVKDVSKYLKVRKIVMGVNDIIMLTTDGLLESANLRDVKFGNDRVNHLILSYKNESADFIVNQVYKNLISFISSDIEDDVTVLAFKRTS